MQKVIITGADGFVGSYTVDYFLKQGVKVLSVGRKKHPIRLKEAEGLTYLSCDVTDIKELLDRVPCNVYDTMIHLAWQGSAGDERGDYELQMQNALNTVAIMRAAKELGCTRFLCAGSIMEYEVEMAVHDRRNRMGMAYIYGMGKHVAHCMCQAVAAQIGIALLWPMITNAYGVGEKSPRFINSTIRKIIHGEKLEFTAATQNYDFIYVTDVAKAFYLIAESGQPFCEYMVGSGNARPLKEYIMEIQRELAPDMEFSFGNVPYTGTDISLDIFDISNIKDDCKFEAEVSFAEGIKKTMEWLKEQDCKSLFER